MLLNLPSRQAEEEEEEVEVEATGHQISLRNVLIAMEG